VEAIAIFSGERQASDAMRFLDGVYVERRGGSVRFFWAGAASEAELTQLGRNIARRAGRFLQRQGLLEGDAGFTPTPRGWGSRRRFDDLGVLNRLSEKGVYSSYTPMP